MVRWYVSRSFAFLVAVCLWLSASTVHAGTGPFVTTWKTDNPGVSDENQITIPTRSDYVYDFDVDWGDGEQTEGATGNVTHTYDEAGTYEVSISGTFPGFQFGFGGDAQKILTVEQWGSPAWGANQNGSFAGCWNLSFNATDAPEFSLVTDMTYMLRQTGLTDEDLSGWDVSNVFSMLGTFQDTDFNGDISAWDTSSVAWFAAMFYNDDAFNGDIGGWDTSSATTMGEMFWGASAFDRDIGSWDMADVTNVGNMFDGAGVGMDAYDALLAGWSAQTLQPNLSFNAGDSPYCDSDARDVLTSAPNNWTVVDGGNLCIREVAGLDRYLEPDEAVYAFSTTDDVEAALDAETSAYVLGSTGCANCVATVNREARTITFDGLQTGDTLEFDFSLTGGNSLHVGPADIFDRDGESGGGGRGRGGKRVRDREIERLGEEGDAGNDGMSIADIPGVDVSTGRRIAVESGTIGVSPVDGGAQAVSAILPGWYVRSASFDTVYFLDADGRRRPIPDAATFFTREPTFDRVVWVTDATLPTLPLGPSLGPRTGSLVKLADAPEVYEVVNEETLALRHVPSEEDASRSHGAAWAASVIDMSPTTLARYEITK